MLNFKTLRGLAALLVILVALALSGCGGNGASSSTPTRGKYDGNWDAWAFQTRDDGKEYSIEMRYSVVAGRLTGTYTVFLWDWETAPQELGSGTVSGTVEDWEDLDGLMLVFDDGRGGGGGGEKFLDVGLIKRRDWIFSTMAYSSMSPSPNPHRYDWGFGMVKGDMGRSTGEPKNPRELREQLKSRISRR